MARPQPIVVPALSQDIEGPGRAQLGQAVGQLLGALGGRAIQRGRETSEQEAFRAAFPSLFPSEVVEAAGPRLPATGLPSEGVQAPAGAELGAAPMAEAIPEDVQALTRILSQTPEGRAKGESIAGQLALQRLTPKEPEKEQAILSPELVNLVGLPAGTEITFAQAKDIGAKIPKNKLTAEEKEKDVQSSKILAGGLTQLVFEDGTVQIVQASEADEQLVKKAEERSAELQGLRGAEREAGKKAIQQSVEAFKQLRTVKVNIKNLEEGITLLDQGAKTGVVEGRLPSVRAASQKLDNLQKRLGLDVIQNTTFGALSENELKFALDSALPKGLNEQQLKQWLTDKRESQRKLADYLEEAAIFLGTPGNTVTDFLENRRASQPKDVQSRFEELSKGRELTPEEEEQIFQQLANEGF